MKLGTIKLYCGLIFIFTAALQCMEKRTQEHTEITPYCEQRDFIDILNIISENPRSKYFQEAHINKQDPCTAIPPLHSFLKNGQTTCLLERCALEIINRSYTHVLRVQEKTVGFICFSLTLKKRLTDFTTQSSGNIIIVALAHAFEQAEYQERLIRNAIQTLQQEPSLLQVEATVQTEYASLHDIYRRLSFTHSQEDSAQNYAVYTFTPPQTR